MNQMTPNTNLKKIHDSGIACDKYREQGFHCAESMIRGCAEGLGLEIPDVVLKTVGAYSGGGGGSRENCGLLLAGAAVISFMFGRVKVDEDDNGCLYLIRTFYERFYERLGSVECRELRPDNRYLLGMKDCAPIFPRAAEILAEVVLNAETLIAEMPEEEKIPHAPGAPQ